MDETPVVKPTAAQKASGVLSLVKTLLAEIATLQRPVTAAAVSLFILQITGVTTIDASTLAGILAGVGGLDAAVEKLVS